MAKRKKKRPNVWHRMLGSIANALQYSLKWRYLLWAVICVLIVTIVIKHSAVSSWLSRVDWVLIKDYLAIVITWPVAVLILGLIFMYKFSDSIREFLRKIDKLKAAGIEMSQQQSSTPLSQNDDKEQQAVDDLESRVQDGSVTLTKEQVEELVNIIETTDFKFLSLHLVQNTKNALRLMTQIEVLKSAFLQVYQVPSHVIDQVAERQAILNSLFEAQLIHEENNILKVTDRGTRFLEFIGTPILQTI